jgi:phosphate acetyltransferase
MYPTLDEKVDIAQNAIDLAHVLGMDVPRVAVLSAVETVSAKIPSTLDAAALRAYPSSSYLFGKAWKINALPVSLRPTGIGS